MRKIVYIRIHILIHTLLMFRTNLTPDAKALIFKACVKAQGGFMQFIYDDPFKFETLESQAMYKAIVIEDALASYIEFRADQLSRQIDQCSAMRVAMLDNPYIVQQKMYELVTGFTLQPEVLHFAFTRN